MVSISWRNILMLIFHNFISFFLFLFVFQLQLSIVLFVIHYQFSNYNYNYVVSGSWLKNSRIAYVNLPSCLKKIGSCLSTHWFCFLFLFCFCFFFVCFSFVLFGFFFRFCFVFFFFCFYSDHQFDPTYINRKIVCLNFTRLRYIHPPRNNQIHDSLAKKN